MRFLANLYVQVLIAIALGVALGAANPDVTLAGQRFKIALALAPLGVMFVALIKMVVPAVIFCSVASGIAHMSDLKKFGRVGLKTLAYFELVSTLALAIGLVVGALLRPGAGFNANIAALDPSIAAGYLQKAHQQQHYANLIDALLANTAALIPTTFASAFVDGNLLQVLLVAVLIGFASARLGAFGRRAAQIFDDVNQIFFSFIHIVVRLAPLGAFGAMAFTIAKFGLPALVKLAALVGAFYATSLLFVLVVLGAIAALTGYSIFRFLNFIGAELLIVLGTSSSESVLPQMIEKLQRLGSSKSVTALVIPTGYSFNLDGTNIYMTLATLFLAQATNTPVTLSQELTLLGVAMLTSKGASGVTGAGFVTLAATLAALPTIPVASLALIIGVDRFMSECRALTNLVGNGVATLAIARWEGELDSQTLKRALRAGPRKTPALGAGGGVEVGAGSH